MRIFPNAAKEVWSDTAKGQIACDADEELAKCASDLRLRIWAHAEDRVAKYMNDHGLCGGLMASGSCQNTGSRFGASGREAMAIAPRRLCRRMRPATTMHLRLIVFTEGALPPHRRSR